MEGQPLNDLPSDPTLSARWLEAAEIALPKALMEEEAKEIFDDIVIRFRASDSEMAATQRDRGCPNMFLRGCRATVEAEGWHPTVLARRLVSDLALPRSTLHTTATRRERRYCA